MEAFSQIIKTRKNPEFVRTYETCLTNCSHQECNFSVNDLLLQPFQRIVKYQLLLKELKKTREKNANDELKLLLAKTLDQVTFTNVYLNHAKRDHDEMKRIRATFKRLNLAPELDSGFLLREALNMRVVSFEKSNRVDSFKMVLLFESCLLLVNRNKLDLVLEDYYEIYDRIAMHDIKCVRKSLEYLTLCFESDKTKMLELHFKSMEELEIWREMLSSVMKTPECQANNHEFSLGNFGRDIRRCMMCDAYFSGIFFQGYKCGYCDCVVHKDCLKSPCLSMQPCEDNLFGFKKNKASISMTVSKSSVVSSSSSSSLATDSPATNTLERNKEVTFNIVITRRCPFSRRSFTVYTGLGANRHFLYLTNLHSLFEGVIQLCIVLNPLIHSCIIYG